MIKYIKSLFSSNRNKKLLETIEETASINKQNIEVVNRFIQLFEKHGITRNQIPSLLNTDGLKLTDAIEQELTPELLEMACKLFATRLEWLEGLDDKLYKIQDCSEYPETYAEFLDALTTDNKHQITAQLVISNDPAWQEDTLLVLEEYILNNDELVVRYHLCSGWISKFWKNRADLTACIAMTLKRNIPIKAWRTTAKLDVFFTGKGFISELYELPLAKNFQPESWISDPIAFLEGVDEGIFGKTAALNSWLDYFDQGYLETGNAQEHAHEKFIAELSKYQ